MAGSSATEASQLGYVTRALSHTPAVSRDRSNNLRRVFIYSQIATHDVETQNGLNVTEACHTRGSAEGTGWRADEMNEIPHRVSKDGALA